MEDPIHEPTAIEYPWITIVPVSLPASPVVQPTPSVQSFSSPDGVQYCDDNPATQVIILERDISLAGCVAWTADAPIDLTLQNRDAEVPVGLALSRPSRLRRARVFRRSDLELRADHRHR